MMKIEALKSKKLSLETGGELSLFFLGIGSAFAKPDNLAIDADGNIYIVEDQPGGIEDIWFARDENHDGVAEAIGKWASLSTVGAESSGLYFDKFKPAVAYINVQHPDSKVDRTIMISAPGPKTKGNNGRHAGHDDD